MGVEVEDPPTFLERHLADPSSVLRCATVVVQSVTGEARAEAEAQAGGSTIDEVNDRRHATNGPPTVARSTGQLEADQSGIGEVPGQATTDVEPEGDRAVAVRQRLGDQAVDTDDGRRVESRDRVVDHLRRGRRGVLDGLDANVDRRDLATDFRVIVGLGDDQRRDLGLDLHDLDVERLDLRIGLGRLLGSRLRLNRHDRRHLRGAGLRAGGGLVGELGLHGGELYLQILQLSLLAADGVDQGLTAEVSGESGRENEGQGERDDHGERLQFAEM